jgi:hypothetical protein
VGRAALEGLRGVKRIENGFKDGKEINIVFYDPALITVREMADILTRTGTYRGIDNN